MEQGQAPIFIVLNAAPEEIDFTLPKMPEYKSWQQVLNTTEIEQTDRRLRRRRRDQGAAALGARLCGRGMNARRFGPQADDGRRDVSAVGAGCQTRRSAARQRRSRWRAATTAGSPLDVAGAEAGTRYKFRIDDEIDVPDPASHFQPDDVSGPSEVIDHALSHGARRTGAAGRGKKRCCSRPMSAPSRRQGTYRAMIEKLDHLVETGITALELMPLADFAGSRNWGYDGVLWYAPDSAYGRPEDLKALIDEAHLRGLMVFLDVVYNHFGPEGNYLGRYAPDFFTDAHTPWGSAIDYRVPRGARLRDRECAALAARLSLRRAAARCRQSHRRARRALDAARSQRRRRRARRARPAGTSISCWKTATTAPACSMPREEPPRGKYRAQWNDDYHHAWHVLLTGEAQGYYGDYQALAARRSRARAGVRLRLSGRAVARIAADATRGEPSGALPPPPSSTSCRTTTRSAIAPLGDRLESHSRRRRRIEAALAITLLAPMPPMLFMGEEWGSKTPFPFFCDFKGDLADAVRKGRREEFAWAYEKYGDEVPDPLIVDDLPIGRARLGRARQRRRRDAAHAGARPARGPPRARSCRGWQARVRRGRMRPITAC